MSDARAIAAVTRTLQLLLTQGVALDSDLSDTTVTTLPLDKARDSNANANQLNLFLYQLMPSAPWRNQSLPQQGKPGETSPPPLGLNLYYLVTAFGKDNDATLPLSHQLIGRAMSVLNDHPLLGRAEIRNAFPDSDLSRQIERIRLTLQPLPVEDIFKLWSGFQTQYRLSAAYEVAVVLIDSLRPSRTPLPVLTRGKGNAGIVSQPDLVPKYPTLTQVSPPLNQPSLLAGDVLTLTGHHLAGDQVRVLLTHPLLSEALALDADTGASATRLTVTMPNTPAKTPVGLYAVVVEVTTAADAAGPAPATPIVRTSNQAGVSLAPEIEEAQIEATLNNGEASVKFKCSPSVLPDQRVSLLVGDQEFVADARTRPARTLSFVLTGLGPGTYFVRLRVAGTDSLLVDRSALPEGLPVFKDQTLVIT